jgi:hypothetical protein
MSSYLAALKEKIRVFIEEFAVEKIQQKTRQNII